MLELLRGDVYMALQSPMDSCAPCNRRSFHLKAPVVVVSQYQY
ncbi:hypothetical protein [Nostoc punctiforme]|nr:hypothetical protein [Nostoc punctiforme]